MNKLWIALYPHFLVWLRRLARVTHTVYHQVVPKVILVLCVLVAVPSDGAQTYDREAVLDRLLAGKLFNFVNWEFDAALAKVGHELVLSQLGLSDTDEVALVRAYMRRVSNFQQLEGQINRVYADPAVKDAATATAELRAQRDQLRAELNARQNLVEAIVQEQIESVLRDEGFAVGGQVIPPLRFRFTELPDVLIISRRDKIERIDQRELTTGLTVDQFDQIERGVDKRLDVSSLVTPIGGLGAYPTMLPETSSLVYTIETAAHEWTHNYLFFAPVGLNYADDPTSRVINETTAVIVENEIGRRVLQRYYPDLVRVEPTQDDQAKPTPTAPKNEPPPFDFNKEMRETRLRADELLAAGKIEEAEAYMEARRAVFVKNGYFVRKLNQAYFAFHGAYNATPGGAPAAGRDPIGPAVQALRQHSASVGDFLRKIATVRTLEDVQRLAGS
ncbi:MAG: hypothetical protein M1546_27350 [Chloroflexi bacterium]|nr:hypothetical protein [Chloroflexota bacterium]